MKEQAFCDRTIWGQWQISCAVYAFVKRYEARNHVRQTTQI